MPKQTIARSVASYDPAGTVVRLGYDPDPTRNVLDDPSYAHEMAHFGQNLTTSLGIEQTLMHNELFSAAVQILSREQTLALPLWDCQPASKRSLDWDLAQLADMFNSTVVGRPEAGELKRYVESADDICRSILPAVFRVGAPNPFSFLYKGRGLGFGLKYGGDDVFFRLDGRFIQEVHAHATSFIARWAHERLNIDDAVTYFHFASRTPYAFLYLAVQKLITERIGQAVYDIQDAVCLCHMSAQVALNTFALSEQLPDLPRSILRTEKTKFEYLSPGYAFLRVLSAALDQFVEPGWALGKYFELMAAALSKLGCRGFPSLMKTNVDGLLAPFEKAILESEGGQRRDGRGYNDYLIQKIRDSKAAILWLLRQQTEDNVIDFVRAPIVLVANRTLRGPVIATPTRYSMISMPGAEETEAGSVPPDLMRGLLIAHVTRKLWSSRDLTCFEPAGSPFQGSVVGCEDQQRCQEALAAGNLCPPCKNELWLRTLEIYPALYARATDQGWVVDARTN